MDPMAAAVSSRIENLGQAPIAELRVPLASLTPNGLAGASEAVLNRAKVNQRTDAMLAAIAANRERVSAGMAGNIASAGDARRIDALLARGAASVLLAEFHVGSRFN
jgi:hypothetical protein